MKQDGGQTFTAMLLEMMPDNSFNPAGPHIGKGVKTDKRVLIG